MVAMANISEPEIEEVLSAGGIIVEYCGELSTLGPHETLTFGRAGTLVIDDNPYLHRVLGSLVSRGGYWWLRNVGRRITIEAVDQASGARSSIAPGTEQVLPGAKMLVGFSAGPTRYELSLETAASPLVSQVAHLDTADYASLPLTQMQRELIVVLAESRLRDPSGPMVLPSNKDAARRLGWSLSKFNSKLDNVCRKLSKAGVAGLKSGDDGQRNHDRREVLVDTAVTGRLVSKADLRLLPPTENFQEQ